MIRFCLLFPFLSQYLLPRMDKSERFQPNYFINLLLNICSVNKPLRPQPYKLVPMQKALLTKLQADVGLALFQLP